jgi:Cof subfamily protein (haloacid dehalogenase superfamily)
MTIKLIASDLDGTLLGRDMRLSVANKDAIMRTIGAGVHFVVATGRSLFSVPEEVRNIAGIQYLITSNGAAIHDNATGERIYARYLSEEAVRSVWHLIEDPSIMKEVFWEGTPYTAADCYAAPMRYGVPERALAYIRETRRPIPDIAAFTEAHIAALENINFNFSSPESQAYIRAQLMGSTLYTLTSSLAHNFEIGPIHVDKGVAVAHIADLLGIKTEEILCVGDNENDASMIAYAGIGVAMANGAEEAKWVADYIAPANTEDGVAEAIKKFVLLSHR